MASANGHANGNGATHVSEPVVEPAEQPLTTAPAQMLLTEKRMVTVDLCPKCGEASLVFEEGCKKYSYCTPFTKESLLYREIFEQYYPGQAEMIKDFWMPNKSWEGCNVNDPSARVLANYGASGV